MGALESSLESNTDSTAEWISSVGSAVPDKEFKNSVDEAWSLFTQVFDNQSKTPEPPPLPPLIKKPIIVSDSPSIEDQIAQAIREIDRVVIEQQRIEQENRNDLVPELVSYGPGGSLEDFFTNYLPAVGGTIVEGAKEVAGKGLDLLGKGAENIAESVWDKIKEWFGKFWDWGWPYLLAIGGGFLLLWFGPSLINAFSSNSGKSS